MSSPTGFNDTVQSYAPWRRGIAWWVVLLQGLILLAIGGYSIWDAGSAGRIIILGLGIYLIAVAIWTIVAAMRGRSAGLSVFGLLAAGGGLVAGLSVSLPFFFRAPDAFQSGFFTFGIALLTIGILTLLAAFVERPEVGIAWATLARGLVWAVLGGYLIYAIVTNVEQPRLIQWIAIGLLVIGVLLAIYSFLLYRQQAAREPVAP